MIRTRKSLFAAVAATGLAVTLALTGCFANPIEDVVKKAAESADRGISEDGAKKMAEDIVKKATGGEADMKFGEIPDSFPSEIPLPDLKVLSAISSAKENGGTWIIQFQSKDPKADAEKLRSTLTGAGFEETTWGNFGPMIVGGFAGDKYGINLGTMPSEDGEAGMLSYTVTTTEK